MNVLQQDSRKGLATMADSSSGSSPSVIDASTWFDERTISALTELTRLPENWDSYGARPIRPWAVRAAIELLFAIMQENTPSPSVTPTNRGGVLLEWHTRGVDLEVEVLSPQRFHIAFEDLPTGIEWEQTVGPALSRLDECIARLSSPA